MLTVQRIHANDAYTYAPYNAYLNDWYALAGDGAAAGQTAQDDTFYYFPRKTAQNLLAARADADVSVLDALESAYACLLYTSVKNSYVSTTFNYKDATDTVTPGSTLTIVNRKGFTLPVTGGFGTLLFSGCLLYTSRCV